MIATENKTIKTKLKNGIILIYREVKPLPIVTLNIFLKLGSVHDPEEKIGLTNLTQGLLLKGTKTRTNEQIATEIESIGASIGTSTAEDYSQISLSVTTKYFNKALDILADVFLNPTFLEEELQKEKVVVKASIKQRDDYIFNVAFDLLRETLYGKHPYANLTCGSQQTVDNITREDIVNWHKKHYGIENVIFVIVGNVSISCAKKSIEKYFSKIPSVEVAEVK
ncbi:MAG: pitrilysin family protein, partial [Elusimicrobiota bacterium]|nr:pitrilysin family protein [Elusimicrobiota bacterium]